MTCKRCGCTQFQSVRDGLQQCTKCGAYTSADVVEKIDSAIQKPSVPAPLLDWEDSVKCARGS